MKQSFGGQFPALLERARQTFCTCQSVSLCSLGFFASLVPELHLAHTSVVAQGLKHPQGKGSFAQAGKTQVGFTALQSSVS